MGGRPAGKRSAAPGPVPTWVNLVDSCGAKHARCLMTNTACCLFHEIFRIHLFIETDSRKVTSGGRERGGAAKRAWVWVWGDYNSPEIDGGESYSVVSILYTKLRSLHVRFYVRCILPQVKINLKALLGLLPGASHSRAPAALGCTLPLPAGLPCRSSSALPDCPGPGAFLPRFPVRPGWHLAWMAPLEAGLILRGWVRSVGCGRLLRVLADSSLCLLKLEGSSDRA